MPIGLPAVVANRHIFNQYVIRVSDRDELQAHLKKKGVGTEVYYPVPMHLQECFAYLGHKAGAFPESERAAKETLALPIHPELTEPQAQFVVDCICEFFAGEPSRRLMPLLLLRRKLLWTRFLIGVIPKPDQMEWLKSSSNSSRRRGSCTVPEGRMTSSLRLRTRYRKSTPNCCWFTVPPRRTWMLAWELPAENGFTGQS